MRHLFGKKSAQVDHPLRFQLYDYALGPKFHAGASREIFLPKFSTPLQDLRGMATLTRRQFGTLQPPQVWFRQQVTRVGIGGVGIPAGVVNLTGLIDPSNNSG